MLAPPRLLCFAALIVPATLHAQLDWRATLPGPGARFGTPMVVDPTGPGLLLYGGNGGNGTSQSDMRRWYRGVWQTISSTNTPGPRSGHGLAADLARQRVVLFGGTDGLLFFGDTWEWDGLIWTRLQPLTSPGPRVVHAMTYDATRSNTVLFGGTQGTFPFLTRVNDTWTWSGGQWTQMTPTVSPPYDVSNMVFDEAAGVVVVVEGGGATTYEWNGSNWRNAGGTLPGSSGVLAYDGARQRIVWYGGLDRYIGPLPDVRERTGTNWVLRTTANAPPMRTSPLFMFDPDTRQILCYGGIDYTQPSPGHFSDAWLLGPVHPADVTMFGIGCMGSGGMPQLTARNLPWLGDSLQIACGNLPQAGAPVVLVLGNSNQTWGSGRLPYQLGFGQPGCQLLVSLDADLLFAAAGPELITWLPIPASLTLAGVDAFEQGFVFDPAANAVGLSVTQGLSVRIGSR